MQTRTSILQLLLLTFVGILILSCNQNVNPKKENVLPKNKIVSKQPERKTLKQILSGISKNERIKNLDLSNLDLAISPDLSNYQIESLDLSYNDLDTIFLDRLPKNLRILKCTHNKLNSFRSYSIIGQKSKYNNSNLNLEEIDFSYNNLKSMYYKVWNYKIPLKRRNESCKLRKVELSNNQLTYVSINTNCNKLDYLDVSNNELLSNIFDFKITTIKTVKRENIQNKLPLKMKTFPKPLPVE